MKADQQLVVHKGANCMCEWSLAAISTSWTILGECVLMRQQRELQHKLEHMCVCSNRAEEMNNSQLAELEDDIHHQLARTEERVRDEVSVILDGILSELLLL